MGDPQRPTKRRKFDFADEFKVIVGAKLRPEPKTYTVQKDVLVKSSDFLSKVCNKEWAEGQTKVVNLTEAKWRPWEVYLQYLYTGEIVLAEEIKFPDPEDTTREARNEVGEAQALLIDTYILADMLMDVNAKNALVDELVSLIKEGGTLVLGFTIQHLFTATTERSPMRKLLIDSIAFFTPVDLFQNHAHTFSDEIKNGIILALMKSDRGLVQKEPRFNPSRCEYHEHDDGHPQCD